VKLRTALLTAAAFGLAACTPAANEPAPATPDPAPIATDAAPAPSGPAAENTTDSLSSTPADPAAPASAVPATPTVAPAAAAGPTAEELANGRAVYAGAGSCAMCHGPTGQGTPMGVALTAGLEYDAIKEKITKGMINSGDKMPPMGAALSADQIDDLSKFVEAGLPQ
jgi:mono/diheme cytochrome c family protein